MLNEDVISLKAGHIIVLGPGDVITASHNGKDRLSVFAVHFDVLDSKGTPLTIPEGESPRPGYIIRDLQLLQTLADGCIKSYRERRESAHCRSHRYLQLLLMHCRDESRTSPSGLPDARIARVVDAIHKEPGKRWSIEAMARVADLSRAQFSRTFREATGMSPMRYVVCIRIARACELLQETSMTVGAIATALSYTDIFPFSRQFKKEKGMTPTNFRALR